jgi:hypothetical protein
MSEHRERSYRGISQRAALHYLESVGGERVDERTVGGGGWSASVESDSVSVGATLTITEVTVHFEGESDTLEEVVDDFSRKAIRAGG